MNKKPDNFTRQAFSSQTNYATRPRRRQVVLVLEEPIRPAGKARQFGYGVRAIANAAGVCVKTVRRAMDATAFDPQSFTDTIRWITARRAAKARPRPQDRLPITASPPRFANPAGASPSQLVAMREAARQRREARRAKDAAAQAGQP